MRQYRHRNILSELESFIHFVIEYLLSMNTFNLLITSFVLFISFILPADATTIIYLQGTCSSGKSTLIKALKSELKSLAIVDEDAFMQAAYVEAVAKRFPEPFARIEKAIDAHNLYHALREREIAFKPTAFDEERKQAIEDLQTIQNELNLPENLSWKQEVSKGIDYSVLQSVSDAIVQNCDVLLDSWYITPERLKAEHPETRIIRVLLYCSLPEAYKRLQRRNQQAEEQGNLSEKRYPRQLVGSFFSLYLISNSPLQPIHKIRKEDLEPTLKLIAQSLIGDDLIYKKPVFTFEEPSRVYFEKMAEEFLKPFNGGISGEFYIAPKTVQDVIIDNTAVETSTAVDSIKKLLASQSL